MKINKILFIFFIFVLVHSNGITLAKDITFNPSIGITGQYDDNIFFTRMFAVSDYISIISPGLDLDYKTERGAVGSNIILDFYNYAQESENDTINIKGFLDGDYDLSERWNLNALFNIIKDTTLETQLEETGQRGIRQDRLKWDAGAGLRYGLTERSNLGIRYRYTNVEFEAISQNDYELHEVFLPLDYRLKTQADDISITPNYQFLDSDTSTVNNIRLLFGWEHRFSETFNMSIQLGPRYTKEDFKAVDATDETQSITADVNLIKRGELSRTSFTYNRGLERATDGQLLEVDRFVLNWNRRLTHRFGLAFLGRLIFNRDVIALFGGDRVFFDLRPSLFYNLTENHQLRLTYSYQQDYDRDLDNRVDRNRIWLTLQFNFPQKM